MPSTEERRRAARRTDQQIKDDQQEQLELERLERDERLGIGGSTADGPQSQSKVGGNLPGKLGKASE